jgi:Transcription activator MBF2
MSARSSIHNSYCVVCEQSLILIKLKMYKVVFFIIIISIASIEGTALSWGFLRHGQVMVFDQFFKDRDENFKLEERELKFSTLGVKFTAIHVIDLTGTEYGGSAKIIQGGIGFTYVVMKLIPYDSRILLLNIQIFGAHDSRYFQQK